MSDHPEKLDLRSQDIADEKRQAILRLFPEVRTEGGKLDLERLNCAGTLFPRPEIPQPAAGQRADLPAGGSVSPGLGERD